VANSGLSSIPEQFKGIALFTPAGDVIYAIDANKQRRWHSDLCVALQELLGLTEPPHFLVPFYTATIDRWWDAHTQQLRVVAELHPLVQKYQALLNVIFQMPDVVWQLMPWQADAPELQMIETYRDRFPALWEEQNLIVAYEQWQNRGQDLALLGDDSTPAVVHNYVLRLFVSGDNTLTERTLQQLHELLEVSLPGPYSLKVIDIYKHPEMAEQDHITAIPTLIRVSPVPKRRIVGEFTDPQRFIELLVG